MTDRMRVYSQVMKSLKEIMPSQPQTHVVTLAMMITGIVMGKNAQLSKMSSEVPSDALEKSIEKRMQRWVRNQGVTEELYFMPFAAMILQALSGAPLVLAMDGSQVGRGCMVLMVGVVYHKRCLPLAWVVYKGKKGHTTAERHIEVLKQIQPWVPKESAVILLGDGEYDNVDMLEWLSQETHWDYVVRTPSSSQVRLGTQQQSLAQLGVTPGSCFTLAQTAFTARAFGPVTAIAWWDKQYDAPIYLISSLSDSALACRYYTKRYRIETLFSDQKSRGFNIHKSHLSAPERISRLLISVALSYIWTIYLGVFVLASDLASLIDQPHRRDKSLFRLGLDWLKHCLKKGLPFSVSFSVFEFSCFIPLVQ